MHNKVFHAITLCVGIVLGFAFHSTLDYPDGQETSQKPLQEVSAPYDCNDEWQCEDFEEPELVTQCIKKVYKIVDIIEEY